MTRALLSVFVLGMLVSASGWCQATPASQQSKTDSAQPPPKAPSNPEDGIPKVAPQDLPPEEDEDVAPKKYSFNPMESQRDLQVGNYYMRSGKYRAAVGRFAEATKWDPTSAEAFFRLGEAEEKIKNDSAAKDAFRRVVQIAPDSKQAHEAKRKLGGKG